MPVTVVVGAQYGGEGKGKIVAYLTRRDNVDIVVRCGGPNSGHTVDWKGQTFRLRLLPAGFVSPRSRLLLAAGSIVNLDILRKEIEAAAVDPARVGIDGNAAIVEDADSSYESDLGLRNRIGSTESGTGTGVIKRIMRNGSIKLAKDVPAATPFLTDVAAEVNRGIDSGARCIIEGTQGFGLSLYHTACYPYATSRDTTAAAFLSEVGVSPLSVTSIVMAMRTFPIRVEGNSGPLKNEISWQELRRLSGYPYEISEYSTVTNRVRRVGRFDIGLVRRAAMVNRPTELALLGADYLEFVSKAKQRYDHLGSASRQFILRLEGELQTPLQYIGTGPAGHEIIDRTREFDPSLPFNSRLEAADA